MEANNTQEAKDNEELKTRSIRATESIFDDLKRLIKKYKWNNQNQALTNLINSYELTNAQSLLTDRTTEIEDFNSHAQAIISAYTRSLEIAEHTEERIKSRIEQADRLIDRENKFLREEYKRLENENKELNEFNGSLSDDLAERNEQIEKLQEQLKSLEDNLAKKEAIIEKFANSSYQSKQQDEIIANLKQEIDLQADRIKMFNAEKQELIDKYNQAKEEHNTNVGKHLEQISNLMQEVHTLKKTVTDLTPYRNAYIQEHPEYNQVQSL